MMPFGQIRVFTEALHGYCATNVDDIKSAHQ